MRGEACMAEAARALAEGKLAAERENNGRFYQNEVERLRVMHERALSSMKEEVIYCSAFITQANRYFVHLLSLGVEGS